MLLPTSIQPPPASAGIDALFDWQLAEDRRRHTWHIWVAAAFLVLLATPITMLQWAGLPLLLWFGIRWPCSLPINARLMFQPAGLLTFAWIAWMATSLFWTADPHQGLRELSGMRWALLVWVLWPVLDARPVLIVALAVAFLPLNIDQALQAAGLLHGPSNLIFSPFPDRISGWTQPVVAASLLTAALGLHLPAALMGAGRERIVAVAGSALTAAAILATGTRGAWIAAGALLLCAGAFAAARLLHAPSARRAFIVPIVIAASIVAAWLVIGPSIESRFEKGVQEIRESLASGNTRTDTGKRIDMARLALDAFRAHPIIGVGAGGYKEWSYRRLREQGVDTTERDIRAHAHSTPLHLAATLGLVGLAIAGALLAVVLGPEAVRIARTPGPLTYESGPPFALLGLILAGAFDAIYINAQTSALLAVLITLCLPRRPGNAPIPPTSRPPMLHVGSPSLREGAGGRVGSSATDRRFP